MLHYRLQVHLRRTMLLLLALSTVLSVMGEPQTQEPLPEDQVNLALRRTADGLLRHAGDSTSRIPAIEQTATHIWRIRLEQPFNYDELPTILQASLDLYGIHQVYEVAVRRCHDDIIDLGYHQFDFLQDSLVPCGGRELSDECHYIEVTFLEAAAVPAAAWSANYWIWLIVLAELVVIWFLFRRKPPVIRPSENNDELAFGHSRLHVEGQILTSGDIKQNLTFRETKLLRLFVERADQLLEREVILQQVWADEGILVGRSVDVFVSRLRKKLAADPSVVIATVHGVGYRLETGKVA